MGACKAVLLASILSAQSGELGERIDAIARPLIDAEITVGMVVGVLRNGKTIVRGLGRISREGDRSPDGDTVYEIGSITKVFTGILLADAVERGLVELEDPVQKHLPEEVEVPAFEGEPIRLVHLSTHASALPRMPPNFEPLVDYSEELLYEALGEIELTRAPGERFAYSNLGVGLLGHLLARIQDRSYEALLEERITRPLGLTDTRITFSPSMKRRLAPGYTSGGQPRASRDFNALAGAGAIRSTVHDLLRFAAHCLSEDSEKATGIAKAIRRSQVRRHVPRSGPGTALGWGLGRIPDTLWHNGGTRGYRAHLAIHTKKKLAVAVLANTTSRKIDELASKTLLLLLGRRVPPIRVRKTVQVDPALLERYAGTYRLTPDKKLTITQQDGKLFAQLTGQQRWRTFAESERRFFYRVVRATITFEVDKDGNAIALVLRQNGRSRRAERLADR